MKWNYQPSGKKRYKIVLWKIANGEKESIDITPQKPCTITDLMPILSDSIESIMGECDDYGFEAYVWG